MARMSTFCRSQNKIKTNKFFPFKNINAFLGEKRKIFIFLFECFLFSVWYMPKYMLQFSCTMKHFIVRILIWLKIQVKDHKKCFLEIFRYKTFFLYVLDISLLIMPINIRFQNWFHYIYSFTTLERINERHCMKYCQMLG